MTAGQHEATPVNNGEILWALRQPDFRVESLRVLMGMCTLMDEYARVEATTPILASTINGTLAEADEAVQQLLDYGYVFELAPGYWQLSGRVVAPLRVGTV